MNSELVHVGENMIVGKLCVQAVPGGFIASRLTLNASTVGRGATPKYAVKDYLSRVGRNYWSVDDARIAYGYEVQA